MTEVVVSKWGNSLAVRLPKQLAEQLALTEGQTVQMEAKGAVIELRAARPRKYTKYKLADLLAEADRLGPAGNPEIVEWGPDVGAEIIDDDYAKTR